jgi:hypothetical protein
MVHLVFFFQIQGSHHHGISPLEDLNIGMVSQFPNDYMHSVCIGVMRYLLKNWKKKFEIDKTIEEINLAIQSVNLSIPSEFTRKPRSLDLIHFWKALESRTFLLYYGPVLMKNFLYFSCAIRILANSTSTEQDIKYANDLLAGFLKGFKDQYPVNKITYIR